MMKTKCPYSWLSWCWDMAKLAYYDCRVNIMAQFCSISKSDYKTLFSPNNGIKLAFEWVVTCLHRFSHSLTLSVTRKWLQISLYRFFLLVLGI